MIFGDIMNDEIKSLFSLSGKVAIITGGNGNLGTEFVKTFRSAGAKVAILDVHRTEHKDENILSVVVDVTNRDSIEKAVKEVVEKLGKPHVLVNCAAIDVPPNHSPGKKSGLLETDEAEKHFDKVMEVNVKGTLLCSQVIGNIMADSGGGSIINIASLYGIVSPDQRIYVKKNNENQFIKPISYCVSKSAIYNLTRYLATYWPKRNVRVNTLSFGGVFNNQDPEFVENYCSKVPLGRMAKKDDYNGAVLFLASDASRYMTGASMVIDGGYTAW